MGLKRARAAARATREPVVLHRAVYEVDGGAVQEGEKVRIDLADSDGSAGTSVVVPKGESRFYPIGAKVRVTVERLK